MEIPVSTFKKKDKFTEIAKVLQITYKFKSMYANDYPVEFKWSDIDSTKTRRLFNREQLERIHALYGMEES